MFHKIFETIDKYNLYGKVAYPKKHLPAQIPALYRWAASRGGVFVNPALTEPFGLTLLEASSCGLPIISTNDGGPKEIRSKCENGLLVDVTDINDLKVILFFFKQKTAYEIMPSLVGSEMCIRDSTYTNRESDLEDAFLDKPPFHTNYIYQSFQRFCETHLFVGGQV